MSKMIPSYVSPEIKSAAEKKIFSLFKNSEGTEDWIVLHSLGISDHVSQLFGEIDFVVIVPRKGIFVLEVKGGRIKRENGLWHFTDRNDMTTSKFRGPFEQAQEGMYSLRDYVKSRSDKLGNLLFQYGVMFPDITFRHEGIEFDSWSVYDANNNEDVVGYIDSLSKGAQNKWSNTYGSFSQSKLPSKEDVANLQRMLRGNIDMPISLSKRIEDSEQSLLQLTEEQMLCCERLEDNQRLLVQGAAGTGKTFLAMEQIRRLSLSGHKVAFFCYNSLLAEWCNTTFDRLPEGYKPSFSGTFHSFMLKCAVAAGFSFDSTHFDDKHFYSEELPYLVLESLTAAAIEFDAVVVDEAQDLVTEEYLAVMDSVLKGGLSRGSWVMLGDFSRQAIYTDKSAEEMIGLLDKYAGFTKYHLTVNCRNTRQIVTEIENVAQETIYRHSIKADGLPVDHILFSTQEGAKTSLENIVVKLLADGIREGDITLLSPRKQENSVCALLDRFSVEDYSPTGNDHISFCTIQSFKGLENKVVIILDIENYSEKDIIYTAVSRATSLLIVFEKKAARDQRTGAVIELLSKKGIK